MERFFKKGIFESSLEGCCRGEGEGDDIELPLPSVEDEFTDVSEPVLERDGAAALAMSPKYCSASLIASWSSTPAKAITIFSGVKKVFLYASITLLSI